MINDSKTEFMLTGTKAQLQKTKSSTLTIGESIISPSTEPLRNLGAWFDCNFNLNFNITKTCRSAFFHLHNIRRVRKYLCIESAEKLVHAFITSRLDYCNSLLYGLPHCAHTKLQRACSKRSCKSSISSTTVLPYHTNIIRITLAACDV